MSEAISGGVRIAYEVLGEGEPLLFVHGLGYDRRGWGPLPALLADEFEVVLFDNRGVGESDVPDGPYAVSQMAADAVAVLDAAGIDRAHVFGVSLGGYIAQEIALTYPDRVRKLVLASTAPGGTRSHPMPQAGLEAFGRFPTLEREAGLRLMVESSLGVHGVRERPELVEEIFAYRLERAPTLAGWQAQAYAGATFDAYDRIPEIAAPTLVIQGGADTVVDPRNADLLGELIPGARVEVVPERGHLVVWQEAELLAPIVREFLRS
ncbi:MAG TPA: alpha/beta fold hydrolase [Gaiellaceae bacterium]